LKGIRKVCDAALQRIKRESNEVLEICLGKHKTISFPINRLPSFGKRSEMQWSKVLVLPPSSDFLNQVIVHTIVVRGQHWVDKNTNC
jgi:hypothetical protein